MILACALFIRKLYLIQTLNHRIPHEVLGDVNHELNRLGIRAILKRYNLVREFDGSREALKQDQ